LSLSSRLKEVESPLLRINVAEDATLAVAVDGTPVKLNPATDVERNKKRKTLDSFRHRFKLEGRILGRLCLQSCRPGKTLGRFKAFAGKERKRGKKKRPTGDRQMTVLAFTSGLKEKFRLQS
jgi:hypothetical protein